MKASTVSDKTLAVSKDGTSTLPKSSDTASASRASLFTKHEVTKINSEDSDDEEESVESYRCYKYFYWQKSFCWEVFRLILIMINFLIAIQWQLLYQSVFFDNRWLIYPCAISALVCNTIFLMDLLIQFGINSYYTIMESKVQIIFEIGLQCMFWIEAIRAVIAILDSNMLDLANEFDMVYLVSILRLLHMMPYLDGF